MCEVASGLDGDDFMDASRPIGNPARRRPPRFDVGALATGEPLQYVLGRWGFRHLDLMVDRRVLIPRPETECVVEVALQKARSLEPPIVCADLGTGSGAIGLSLAMELPIDGVTVWMTDRSADALDVARANARGHRPMLRPTCGSPRGLVRSLATTQLRGRAVVDRLQSSVCRRRRSRSSSRSCANWEPADGLVRRRRRTRRGSSSSSPRPPGGLAPGGWLVLEIGASTARRCRALLGAAGTGDVTVSTDLSGHDRVVAAAGDVLVVRHAATDTNVVAARVGSGELVHSHGMSSMAVTCGSAATRRACQSSTSFVMM